MSYCDANYAVYHGCGNDGMLCCVNETLQGSSFDDGIDSKLCLARFRSLLGQNDGSVSCGRGLRGLRDLMRRFHDDLHDSHDDLHALHVEFLDDFQDGSLDESHDPANSLDQLPVAYRAPCLVGSDRLHGQVRHSDPSLDVAGDVLSAQARRGDCLPW